MVERIHAVTEYPGGTASISEDGAERGSRPAPARPFGSSSAVLPGLANIANAAVMFNDTVGPTKAPRIP